MYCFIGLGNPGESYTYTRHNVGFRVIDSLVSHITSESTFERNTPLNAELVSADIHDTSVVIAKPLTYMNDSGRAVRTLIHSFHIDDMEKLVVIHDDMTLELGHIKISKGTGAGNHNGVQSIIDHIKTKNFIRVRCGIGRGEGVLSDVVLSKFKPFEQEAVDHMIDQAVRACFAIVEQGAERAMNLINERKVDSSAGSE